MNEYPQVHLRAIEPEDLDLLYRIEMTPTFSHVSWSGCL